MNNKLKSIVFGSKLSLRSKLQLEFCIKGVTIEQVEEAKLLSITLDSHINKVIVMMERGIYVIKSDSELLTQKSTVLMFMLWSCPILITVW